ncbi:MAG: ammonia-forming cytochrome c nitrite reductase subunit c552, partial [Candidatus Neomarinimicrobiota bacterium]
MRYYLIIALILLLTACGDNHSAYRGSRSCRKCHENFYALWEDSHHGLAMQDFNAAFARSSLSPCDSGIRVADANYRFIMRGKRGYIVRREDKRRFRIRYVLGGKYVYYFLTPFEKGKLQTLPLGYDVRSKTWFDITASAIRMHPDVPDRALPWTDRRYTFNTACFSCHVSQLSTEYDFARDRYRTRWLEAGINCETCHGPAELHNTVFKDAERRGYVPDSTYIRTITQDRGYSAAQVNAVCSYCHAKIISLTPEYVPGDEFFDHYDLITYENPDYYPDGRDLGENYTYTSWLMSNCVKNSNMDCLHCHSSSGRYIQKDDPNTSCLPCHEQRVSNASAHTFHRAISPGNICINCHMPKTDFARMTRSDHSMRPPMPALSDACGSPNACNLCHRSKSTAWADSLIRKRYSGRFQSNTRRWADVLQALRRSEQIPAGEIIAVLREEDSEIVRSSILRSLPPERETSFIPLFSELLRNPSPLVRAALIMNLSDARYPELHESLLAACSDSILLVRIRAAEALSGIPDTEIPQRYRSAFLRAKQEYRKSLESFPDNEMSHYNLGNYYSAAANPPAAAASYRRALRLRPDYAEAAVNLGLLYYESGRTDSAMFFLQKAAREHPELPAAQINLGLLYSESGKHR